MPAPVVALILASGASWESTALALLERDPGVVVLRRCVDVPDLLAAASAGQADAALVALESPELDQAAVDHLRRFQVRTVAVVPAGASDEHGARAARLGIVLTVADDRLAELSASLRAGEPPPSRETAAPEHFDARTDVRHDSGAGRGRVLVVWGPAGAPGRTTVAVALAAELAARGRRTTLVDADPYGGTVAQQLGVLDEVSGLLAAARLAGTAQLAERFAGLRRTLGEHLGVVTGLPRADRWAELRAGSVHHLLEVAAAHGDVVVDTGFSLEDVPASDVGGRAPRNHATVAALAAADDVLVVGAADPVGLARLVRGLVELSEVVSDADVHVVVNRMRGSLGWSEKDVAGMVQGFTAATGPHFLPEDQAAVDRALVGGRTLVETGDSPLRRAVASLVDAVVRASVPVAGRRRSRSGARVRRRTAGTTRRR